MHSFSIGGTACAATATLVLGTSFAASRLLTEYPFWLSQGARYAIGAAALAVVLLLRRSALPRLNKGELTRVVLLAATGLVGFNVCLLAALRESDPAAVGVVVGCVPLVLGFAGPLTQRRSPSGRLLTAAALVSTGAAAVQSGGSTTLAGFGWALGALAGEAAFSLLALPLLPRLGPLALSLYASLAATAMMLMALLSSAPVAVPPPSEAELWAIVYLGTVVTAGAFICWYAGIARLGVERAGLFAGLVPVAALVSGALLDQALPSPLRIAGAVVVGMGVSFGLGSSGTRLLTQRRKGAKEY